MAGLDPAIQGFLVERKVSRGRPGKSAKTRFALLPGHDELGGYQCFYESSTGLRNC
jgi:hypothetical protein